jgi:hypothetical protein
VVTCVFNVSFQMHQRMNEVSRIDGAGYEPISRPSKTVTAETCPAPAQRLRAGKTSAGMASWLIRSWRCRKNSGLRRSWEGPNGSRPSTRRQSCCGHHTHVRERAEEGFEHSRSVQAPCLCEGFVESRTVVRIPISTENMAEGGPPRRKHPDCEKSAERHGGFMGART